jgi:hypothetical protein
MLDGFAQAMGTTNSNIVYQFCSQYFQTMVELMHVYRHSPEMMTDILSFFASLFENFVSNNEYTRFNAYIVLTITLGI